MKNHFCECQKLPSFMEFVEISEHAQNSTELYPNSGIPTFEVAENLIFCNICGLEPKIRRWSI